MKTITIRHGGRSYEARVERSDTASPTAEATGAAVWHVTEGGRTVTTFPASDGDSADAVRTKVTEWLTANEDRPQADVGRQ